MPELPEVEITRRGVEPHLAGRVILATEVARPRMLRRQPRPRDFRDRMEGRRVRGVRRHGKFMLVDLAGDLVWVTHLGMSGRIQVAEPTDELPPHANVVITTDRVRQVRLIDPRTFGFMAVYTPAEYDASSLARLGPDALTDMPRTPALAEGLSGRTTTIKALLLNQNFLAGVGNIYADESLHRARIRPERPAGSLSRDEVKRLRDSIGAVLRAGLRHGGTSLDDLAYLLPDGRAGTYVTRLRVYGREGEPCRRCGAEIRRRVLGQRSSYWCPSCQR